MPVFNRYSLVLNRQVLQEGRKVSAIVRVPFSFFNVMGAEMRPGGHACTLTPSPKGNKRTHTRPEAEIAYSVSPNPVQTGRRESRR